jgi:hypothetical protein
VVLPESRVSQRNVDGKARESDAMLSVPEAVSHRVVIDGEPSEENPTPRNGYDPQHQANDQYRDHPPPRRHPGEAHAKSPGYAHHEFG